MLRLTSGTLLSLLPQRYRERFTATASSDLRSGAIVGGLLQTFVCLGFFIVRYLRSSSTG